MVRRGADTSPSEPTHKKRRISHSQPAAMSQTEEVQTPQLPELQLTPIESTLKELLLDVAGFIHEQAIANGGSKNAPQTELRFTGGWVRDKLLGVDSHDIDVGISTMTGYQYGLALKEYLDIPENLDKYKKNHPDGELSEAIVSLHKIDANPEKSKHLETVTTKIFGLDIDMVNLRQETYSEDSRNPQMEFGTAQEDAMRRDATINALFYNLNESKVEDLTGLGITDMQNKIIRTPLEPLQTFKDDPLRILRLIRFASRLGYQIHEDTEKAMNNDEIGEALKLKISRERVGTEIHKMLEGPITHLKARVYTHIDTGPDPRGALTMIDRTGLYPTIFANLQDDVHADTTTWPLAYNTLEELLHPAADNSEEFKAIINRVRSALVRDESEAYYAWLIAALAPWIDVPDRTSKTKPNAPRSVEVARDSLRADNKTNGILRGASKNWKSIVSVKSGHIKSDLDGTPAEIRQHIGLHLRTWNKDWRLCLVAAILQEAMQGRDFSTGMSLQRYYNQEQTNSCVFGWQ